MRRRRLIVVVWVWLAGPAVFATEVPDYPRTISESFFWVTASHRKTVDVQTFFGLFEAGAFSLKPDDAQSARLPYALFRPEFKTGMKYSLIVWLHGYGEDEVELPYWGQLKHAQLVFGDPGDRAAYQFYFLAPQHVLPRSWFSTEANEGTSKGDLLIALIHQLISTNPIDPNRVTVVGLSSGARAAWECALHSPRLFAAIAPLGADGCDSPDLDRLVSVPVWAFHGEHDRVEADRETIARLRLLGGYCDLTETPGAEHNAWYWAFEDHDLLSWLLAQQKGIPTIPPTGQSIFNVAGAAVRTYWPHLVVILVVIVAFLCVRKLHQSDVLVDSSLN